MTKRSFKQRIRSGSPALGTLVTVGSPAVVEALSMTGLDWLFIDLEHGALGIETAEDLVRAVRGDCYTLVRIPENSPVWIHKALDIGCDGLIVPQVCSEAEAWRAVEHATYPPLGGRSVGVARAHGYGLNFAQYVANANEQLSLIIQIEHISAVRNLAGILDVPGIDGVLIGPYDLSGSMNVLGQVDHPAVQEAMAAIRVACTEREIPFGVFVLDRESVPAALATGVSFLAVGTELSFMCNGAMAVIETARNVS
ncbi:MAG TPA: aldolase/citrate lyase family protein [Chloroflexota bacterium]